jgi:uncharacterized protein (DUF1697 family)
LEPVQTYIQSGNVIFHATGTSSDKSLENKIAKSLFEQYNFEVPVIVRKWEELRQIATDNPFLKEKDIDENKLHVTFLSEIPAATDLSNIQKMAYPPDRFIIQGREVYVYCPVNYGETKLSNTFFEQKLKVTATTRNWKTVNKLVEMGRTSGV